MQYLMTKKPAKRVAIPETLGWFNNSTFARLSSVFGFDVQ